MNDQFSNTTAAFGKIPVIAPDQLRPTPELAAAAGEFQGAIAGHVVALLQDPAFKTKVVDLIKAAIPGKVFDWLAVSAYDMAVSAISTVLDGDRIG